ncbi:MAG: winged helix-turn-helix transcriptional regulator [Acidobacteriota bacterium]|nr:winged helix-turn-helix transcriptional regulator [Acidobacteriota bacterium]
MTERTPEDLVTALGLLFEASSYLRRNVSADLERDAGLDGTWFEVLTRLDRTPGHEMRMNAMAAQVSFPPSSFSRLIDKMEAAGVIERCVDPSSRRATLIRPTPGARELLARANAAHARSAETHFAGLLSAKEVADLMRITRKLRDANREPSVLTSGTSARGSRGARHAPSLDATRPYSGSRAAHPRESGGVHERQIDS